MNVYSKHNQKRGIRWLLLALALLLMLLPFGLKSRKDGGSVGLNTVNASAASTDLIRVEAYSVNMVINYDRKISVTEHVTVRFLRSGLSMFYRSLPMDGARYFDIEAKCEGNDEFSYYVASNPDTERMLDINCVGNADRGKVWTYEISYVMEQGTNEKENGMIIDVVGFGWTVPLYNVEVAVTMPDQPIDCKIYAGQYGTAYATDPRVPIETTRVQCAREGATVYIRADVLDVTRNAYGEDLADGITLEYTVAHEILRWYSISRIATEDMWFIALLSVLFLVGSGILLFTTREKRDLITVVNVKAPKNMDPMKMGKWLDGTVDAEDITSMIYYFANKGYLRIDFEDEDDPLLISLIDELPPTATTHEKTLFKGLFENAEAVETEDDEPFEEKGKIVKKQIRVSEMAGKFYETSRVAIEQLPETPKMYEKKSIFGYIGGAVLGSLFAFLIPLLMGLHVGGGYVYGWGIFLAVPIVAIAVLGWIRENYRYKWSARKWRWTGLARWIIAIVFSLIFIFGFAKFIMTGFEKLLVCIVAFGCCMITQPALSRTENYLSVLGEILGFKDFIVVTEEDKLKVMLESSPSLYYKILPYAQVLGVTDIWEKKFKNILLQPPVWYSGTEFTVFDYLIISRCMRHSMLQAVVKAQTAAMGGGKVSRFGGGTHFGGFGGGGFGGGGGGAR